MKNELRFIPILIILIGLLFPAYKLYQHTETDYTPIQLESIPARYHGPTKPVFLCPVPPAVNRFVTSPYGERHVNGERTPDHDGIDLSGTYRSEIYSSGNGIVYRVSFHDRVLGKAVWVIHDNGWMTIYGHLSGVYCKPGQKVKSGECIGRMGATGISDGEHLHFEIRQYGIPVNPLDYIPIIPDSQGRF